MLYLVIAENIGRLLKMVFLFNFEMQMKKKVSKRPLKAAPHDQPLPLCWHGRGSFKSIHEVNKYFNPLTLSFTNGGLIVNAT